MASTNAVIRKHWQLIVFVLGLVLAFVLLWLLRNALLPFLLGFILASLLLPIIRWVEKRLPETSRRPKLRQFIRNNNGLFTFMNYTIRNYYEKKTHHTIYRLLFGYRADSRLAPGQYATLSGTTSQGVTLKVTAN